MGEERVDAGGEKSGSGSGGVSGVVSAVQAALLKHWFLVGVALSILGAQLAPWIGADSGPLYPKITVKYGAVIMIFLISGLSMRPDQMRGAVANVRMHCFIQGFTLIIVPMMMKLIFLPNLGAIGLPPGLVQVGLLPAACCLLLSLIHI